MCTTMEIENSVDLAAKCGQVSFSLNKHSRKPLRLPLRGCIPRRGGGGVQTTYTKINNDDGDAVAPQNSARRSHRTFFFLIYIAPCELSRDARRTKNRNRNAPSNRAISNLHSATSPILAPHTAHCDTVDQMIFLIGR